MSSTEKIGEKFTKRKFSARSFAFREIEKLYVKETWRSHERVIEFSAKRIQVNLIFLIFQFLWTSLSSILRFLESENVLLTLKEP